MLVHRIAIVEQGVSLDFSDFGVPSTSAAWDLVPVLQGNPAEWRLLVVGQVMDTGSPDINMGFMYLGQDGSIDVAVPSSGRFTLGPNVGGGEADRLKAVAAFSDRRSAVAAGTSETSATTDSWMFYKIEEGFNIQITGFDPIPFATTAELEDVATYPDGKVVAAGSRDQHGDAQMVIARLDTGGGLDLDFGFSRQFTDVVFADGFESDGWWGADWGWDQ